jgi:hypothetical protein
MKNTIQLMLSALALAGFQAYGNNLVVNGDFSSGFNGWTPTGGSGDSYTVFLGANNPTTGSSGYAWEEGAVGSDQFFSQSVATTPGTYDISLWLRPYGGWGSDYQVSFGGVTLFEVNDSGSGETFLAGNTTEVVGGSFTLYQWNEIELVGTATGDSTLLQLGIRQDSSWSYSTDVSVTAANVPDAGSSLALLATGLTGICGVARKFRRN